MSRRRRVADERGETLLELLIAITIMGVALVAIMAGVTTSILMSDIHRKQATAGAAVHTYAEVIENYVARSAAGYHTCASTLDYAPATVGFAVPTGFGVTASAAKAWNGTNWVPCTTDNDNGLQKVTLGVASSDSRATETLDVILRRPCRPAPSTDGPCS
jgi:prepilin-type N-terminal cleavage/methylation domain-containing protein